jgi:hypothetical protein
MQGLMHTYIPYYQSATANTHTLSVDQRHIPAHHMERHSIEVAIFRQLLFRISATELICLLARRRAGCHQALVLCVSLVPPRWAAVGWHAVGEAAEGTEPPTIRARSSMASGQSRSSLICNIFNPHGGRF